MAKALYGHLAADPALVAQVQHLRRQVQQLEAELQEVRTELAQVKVENDALAPLVTDDELVRLREPANRSEVVLT